LAAFVIGQDETRICPPQDPERDEERLRDAAAENAMSVSRATRPSGNSPKSASLQKEADAVRSIRILVVTDIRLYREGVAQILNRREGLVVVGTAANRGEALVNLRELAPQVVLLDMATPESHATARDIERSFPQTPVVALGVAEVEGDVLACAEAGIAAYVPRKGSVEDLVVAVENAARGEVQCCPQFAASLWRRVAALSANQPPGVAVAELTRREREIVRLIDQDLSNKEIAQQLGIELATVKNHVHNLLDKLHVSTRAQAAACMRVAVPPRLLGSPST
jgi:DNA-binding NarL/FixJ family response regulator